MKNKQIEVITALYHYILDSRIFKTNGHRFDKEIAGETLTFHACVTMIVDRIHSLESDNDAWLYIGEYLECPLNDFIVAAFWACGDCHGGQFSRTYALQCKLGEVFKPGMGSLDSESDTVRETYQLLCNYILTLGD